jgi:hypothetical protein
MRSIPTLLGVTLVGMPVAHADNASETEVEAYAVTAADSVCQMITNNPTIHGVDDAMDQIQKFSNYSPGHVGLVTALSVRGKCPQYIPVLEQWLNAPMGTGPGDRRWP